MKSPSTSMFLVFCLLLAACTGSKKLAKQAGKLDAGGMYAEAAELYLQSALRNTNNVQAKLGLKKTGQQVLDDRMAAFFKAANMGDGPVPAVDAYMEALAWRDRVQGSGVQLSIPEHFATDYQRVKGEALVELYGKGQAMLAASDYAGAKTVFAKIAAIEPGYKDAASLQAIAYLEPLYQQRHVPPMGRKDNTELPQ
jgi:tetratricopeptide (TPR) repeat protein